MGFYMTAIPFLVIMFVLWRSVLALDPSVVTTAGGTFTVHHSASQLSLTSDAEVIIVPGSVLDTGISQITGRYACGDYTAVFAPVLNKEIRITVSLTGLPTKDDDPECTIYWDDGNDDTTGKFTSGPEIVTHTYSGYGVYAVNMVCTSDLGSVSCPARDTSCVATSDFLDNSHKQFGFPLKFFNTDNIFIPSFLELTPTCASGSPLIVWRITHVDVTIMTDFASFTQPNSSVITLDPGVLDPGEYVVHLELLFPHMGSQYWVEDSMTVRIIYPELVAHIYGGDDITVPYGSIVTVDASKSFDPAGNLTDPITHAWSVSNGPMSYGLRVFQAEFPFKAYPGGVITQQVTLGTDYLLELDTSKYLVNSVCFVVFSIMRGTRESSALQVLRIKANTLPLSIKCVFNCNFFRENKYNEDRLELDTVLPQDTTGFTYEWSILLWTSVWGIKLWQPVLSPETISGITSRSIGILKSQLQAGKSYKVKITVTAPDYSITTASVIGYINYLPYDGTCAMSTLTGTAARDWFVFTCNGWKGSDDRWKKNALADTNPYLTFTVRQYTKGAFVEEEPILQTRSERSHVILKVGDPDDSYKTTVIVRVSDIYNNFIHIPLTVTANPAFAWYNVNASQYGADLVEQYTTVDYVFDEQQLRYMGRIDMVIPLVTSVCSHIHLIELPVWQPPVPRELNVGGSILDLNPNGNTETGSLGDVLEATIPPPLDPATLSLMEVMQNMTNVVRDMIDTYIVNGNMGTDKHLLSMIINAFTNLAARDQFANNYTRDDLIYLGEVIGVTALKPVPNAVADQSAQIEVTSGEIYNMSKAIVNTVVPNELKQGRIVKNYLSGRQQVSDMLAVVGQGIDVTESDLSPGERAYLYQSMQGRLRLDLDARKAEAKKAAIMALKLAKEVEDKMKVCETCSNENSLLTKQLVKKNTAEVIKSSVNRMDQASFRLDDVVSALGENETTNTVTSISAIELDENVFMYDSDQVSSYVTSNVLHLDVRATGNENYVSPGYITFGQDVEAQPELVTPTVDSEDASEFSQHKFVYQSISDYVCIVIKPENETAVVEYKIYIRFVSTPTVLEYDMVYVLTKRTFWKVCIEPADMKGHQGMTFLAVHVPGTVKNVKYYFTLVTAGCLTWEEAARKWHTDKCEMVWVPEFNKMNCLCRNLTDLTFANSFFVAPNTIDFSSVFLKFSPLNQAAVMGALGGLFVIYIILIILVIPLDRRDKLKWGITPLRDNIYGHSHYYIIKVFTGMRHNAGTRSRVAFNLLGVSGQTGPRELFDGVREHFSTGSVMTLFMATEFDLGALIHLNIWHDNSGEGDDAEWYLNYVAIYDIARNETTSFVAEQWLSLETTLELMIEATNTHKVPLFENRFFRQTRDRLSESHMWVSILYRPMSSSFTRVQRASCALVYICLAMIANAMYFNPDPDYATPALLQIGPLRFTGQQMFISLICALITTPVVMLLIFLFKRTRPWPRKPGGRKCCAYCKCACPCAGLCCTKRREERRHYEAALKKLLLTSEDMDTQGSFCLHHCFIILAWFLVVAGTMVPAFFIMLYSMEWGKQKSEEWLTAFLLSVVQSMLFVDPVVVVCMAFLFACIMRKGSEPVALSTDALIENYKRWMGETTDDKSELGGSLNILRSIKEDYHSHQVLPRNVTKPLHGVDLVKAAQEHRHNQQLNTLLKDILLNLFFMAIIFCICYSNRGQYSYYHHREIENNLVTPSSKYLPKFHAIKKPGDWFKWLNKTAIPFLFPENDFNDQDLHWIDKQYTYELANFRLGPPRLRQLRIEKDTCYIPEFGEVDCYGEYGFFKEVEEKFCVGWSSYPCSLGVTVSSPTLVAWEHVSALDIWGLPIPGELSTYSGGGYMAAMYISRNASEDILNELFSSLWLDRQTRAVFFEFTLYCANTNTFTYNMFLVEFPQTGGGFTTHSTYPMRLYTHQGATGTFTLICEVIFVIIIIIFIVKISIRFYQQRCSYFKKFWQVFELLMLMIGLTAIVMYAFRLIFTKLTVDKFNEDMTLFVNFSHIVFWDQMFVSMMAILTFMATIRFLEIFSTSKKVSAVVKIFKGCGRDLFWFGTTFLYILIGFAGWAFLLFGAHLYAYMNPYMSIRTLSLVFLGSTNFPELVEVKPILAKVFFVLFIMAIVFFVMTIFMSILGGSIDSVMHDTMEDTREDLIEQLMRRFKTLIIKPSSKTGARPDSAEDDKFKPKPTASPGGDTQDTARTTLTLTDIDGELNRSAADSKQQEK